MDVIDLNTMIGEYDNSFGIFPKKFLSVSYMAARFHRFEIEYYLIYAPYIFLRNVC